MSIEGAGEKAVPQAAVLKVLTWGSSINDSMYIDPLRKVFKGQNAGHGAFVLELPDTPENEAKFRALLTAGYPGDVAYVPKVVHKTDHEGNTTYHNVIDENGNVEKERRFIVRYSPYFYSFGDIGAEGTFQKTGRPEPWDPDVFKKLKGTQIVTEKDLTDAGIDKKLAKKMVAQVDELFDQKSMKAFLEKHDSEERGSKILEKLNTAMAAAYTRYFNKLYHDKLTDSYRKAGVAEDAIPRKIRAHIQKMVDETLKGRQYSSFRKQETAKSAPVKILHLDRMTQADAQLAGKDSPTEASSLLYGTYGQPPDRIDEIPFKTEQHGFGLDLDRLTDEMLRIKHTSNEKIYRHIVNKSNQATDDLDADTKDKISAQRRNRVEADFVAVAKKHLGNEFFKKDPPTIAEYFNALSALKTKELENDDKTAIAQYESLWKDYFEVAYDDDLIVQDTYNQFTFNCCRATKDCIRAGLDRTYKGYLTEPFLAPNSLTTPGQLAHEAAQVADAIRSDRMTKLDASQTNYPPVTSMLKGIGLRLRNNNFTLLPTRSIIRPLAMLTDAIVSTAVAVVKAPFQTLAAMGRGLVSLFSSKPQTSTTPSDKEAAVTEFKADKETKQLLEDYINYNAKSKRKEPFLISTEVYNQIINQIQSMGDDKVKIGKKSYTQETLMTTFKIKYDQVSKDAFAQIREKEIARAASEAKAGPSQLGASAEQPKAPLVKAFTATAPKSAEQSAEAKPVEPESVAKKKMNKSS